jgi:hypothetical protein
MSASAPLPQPITAAVLAPLRHGFFTRRGGVSEGPFASLNCSLFGRDDPALVMENRARAASALGVDLASLVGLRQVHGTTVVPVRAPWPADAGPQADALVTDRPGIALGIVTADCAPVLFADADAGVIGAAHAGWRGAVAGVLEATVAAMLRLGARRSHLTAVVGPCIAPASYEVGSEVREAVAAAGDPVATLCAPARRPGHWQFDLPGLCLARLQAAGVAAAVWTGHDTLAEPALFFSHRRRTLAGGGPIGHQLAAIVL